MFLVYLKRTINTVVRSDEWFSVAIAEKSSSHPVPIGCMNEDVFRVPDNWILLKMRYK